MENGGRVGKMPERAPEIEVKFEGAARGLLLKTARQGVWRERKK